MNTPEFKDLVTESPIYEKFLELLSWQYKIDTKGKENNGNNDEHHDNDE